MNEGMVALLVVVGTILGVLLGVRIQARRQMSAIRIAPARERQLWVPAWLLALSVAFVGLLMWIGIQLLMQWVHGERDFVRHPVREIRITEDVNGGAIAPWEKAYGSARTELHVDRMPKDRRGRDGALRVTFDLPSSWDTAAIQVSGPDLPDRIGVATAWVYLENSDAAQTAGVHARLVARMKAGSSGSFSVVGDRTPLKRGAWTQVVWTGSYALELSPALGDLAGEKTVRASGQLTFLALRLETDQAYRGSVFVDDLRVYAADASRNGPRQPL